MMEMLLAKNERPRRKQRGIIKSIERPTGRGVQPCPPPADSNGLSRSGRGGMGMMDPEATEIEVMAYSGYRANERPLYLVIDGRRLEVKDVLDRWYGQAHDYFKVLAGDDRIYLIRWYRSRDIWSLMHVRERTAIP